MLKELTAYLRGWKSYFGYCQTPSLLNALDAWIRRRLRSTIWKQWKAGKQRTRSCATSGSAGTSPRKRRGVRSVPGIWRTARPCLTRFPSPTSTRLDSLVCSMALRNLGTAGCGPARPGGVAGASGRPLPLCRLRRQGLGVFVALTVRPA
jgi:hypothetical protein